VHLHVSITGKLLIVAGIMFILALGSCSEDGASPTPENVSAPSAMTGPQTIETMKIEHYCCSGAGCNEGHGLEYQFDWSDGDSTAWLTSSCASHGWVLPGSYDVKSRARCEVNTDIVSSWSASYIVQVVAPAETVTTPDEPSGALSTALGQTEIYCTGNAISNMGHILHYQFDWGDGHVSSWSTDSCASHSWEATGTYTVKAQARCATHHHIVSPWSDAIDVSVVEEEIPSPPGVPCCANSVCPDESKIYSTSGTTSSLGHLLEYRMDFGDGYVSPWSSFTSISHIWADLGYYDIRAQARCSTHTSIVSEWSNPRTVRAMETLSTPGMPNGPETSSVGLTATICGGASTSSCGHGRQRQWRINGEDLSWGGEACLMVTFTEAKIYYIRVRVRCSIHHDAVSDWSIVRQINVTD
jgi:hypothetical protein